MAGQRNPGRKYYVEEIEQQLARLVSWVEIANKNNHPNISVISENMIGGLLNLVYGWNLNNTNTPNKPNFPGIDLLDDQRRIAVQVTAKNSLDKVKDMLGKVQRNNLDTHFDRLILMEITNQDPTREMRKAQTAYFSGKQDIWNIPLLMREISNLDIDQLANIAAYLDREVGSLYTDSRKGAKQPKGKKSRAEKKRHGRLWYCAILAVLLLGGLLLFRSKKLREMPEALSTYTIIINEEAVSLPTTFSRLEEMGWVFQDTSEKGDWLAPGTFNREDYRNAELQTELTNGYGTMDVWYGNPSDHSLRTEDCVVYQISVSTWGKENSASGKPANRIRISDSFVLGQSKWEDQKRPEGYTKINRDTLTNYWYLVDDNHWYSFMFDLDTGILTDAVVCNRDRDAMEALTGEAYDIEAPAYDPGELRDWLGADLAFQVGEYRIPVGCTVDAYRDLGYRTDECPEYLASMDHDDLHFRCDEDTGVKGKVYNPYPRALLSDWCYMGCLDSRDIRSEAGDFVLECSVGEKILRIPRGMAQDALIQSLENMDLDWINSSADSITFFPRAHARDVAVVCIFDGDRTVSRIQVDMCEALRGYFFGLESAQ